MNHCIRHFEEPVAGVRRTCQCTFCDRCLVYAFGPQKPPYCVGCALDASGVRSPGRGGRPPRVTLEAGGAVSVPGDATDRCLARAEKRAVKATARATKRTRSTRAKPSFVPAAVSDPSGGDTFVPAPGQLATHRCETTSDQLV